jgi:hypothetical protein
MRGKNSSWQQLRMSPSKHSDHREIGANYPKLVTCTPSFFMAPSPWSASAWLSRTITCGLLSGGGSLAPRHPLDSQWGTDLAVDDRDFGPATVRLVTLRWSLKKPQSAT